MPEVSKPIRVLSVTKSTGGLARFNDRLCRHLDKTQFDISVVCLSDNNIAYAAQMAEIGIEATPMEMSRYRINLLSDFRLTFRLLKFIRAGDYDILIGHGSKAGFLVRLIGRLTGTPAIYRLASMSFVPRIHGWKAHLFLLLERLGALLGGHIVTVAESTGRELIKRRVVSDKNTTAIHTGIDLDHFSNPLDRAQACEALGLDPARLVVGWAARLVDQKAPLDFIKAAEQIIKAIPDIQILMAGEGPLKDAALHLADELGIRDSITFIPWQSDVRAMLSAFDVYVLSSHWEGLPQSLLEALAMHRASIATAVDGNTEIIQHGVDGFLVELGDVDAMAHHAIELVKDKPLRERIGDAGRVRVEEHFYVKRMIEDWQSLIRRMVS